MAPATARTHVSREAMCIGEPLERGAIIQLTRTELPCRPSTVQNCTMFFIFPMESQEMRLCFPFRRAQVVKTATIAMAIVATSVSAFGQSGQSPLNLKLEGAIQAAAGQAAAQTQETTRPLSI